MGAAGLLVLASAACSGGAPAQASKPASQSSSERAAPKAAASPGTPKPSPTPDPAGRTEPVAGQCPETHQIKGATSDTGVKWYYEPDRPSYPTVTPEVCFTAGGDARANGYQANRN